MLQTSCILKAVFSVRLRFVEIFILDILLNFYDDVLIVSVEFLITIDGSRCVICSTAVD